MSAQDTDDALLHALEPDEKIVWSDRPHRISSSALHMLWTRLTKISTLVALAFIAFVVSVFMRAEASPSRAVTWETVAMPVILGLAALPILLEAFWFLTRVARTSSHRYAVTDKGRGVFVMPDVVGTFELTRPEQITTRARADQEHGDIDLGMCTVTERGRGAARRGLRRVVFRDVSYPLIALETIRSVSGGPRKPPLLT